MIEENYAEDGKFKSVIKAFGISEDALNSRLDEISDTLKTVEIIAERNVLDLKIVIESDNFIDFGKAVKMFSESFQKRSFHSCYPLTFFCYFFLKANYLFDAYIHPLILDMLQQFSKELF